MKEYSEKELSRSNVKRRRPAYMTYDGKMYRIWVKERKQSIKMMHI
jgi:predicted heme/steroid binding protein